MSETISEWTKDLNPVLQGILGSAIFALVLWLGRKLYEFLTDLSKSLKKGRQYHEVTKIVIHKRFINSNGMFYFTQGFLLVIFKSLYNLFLALIFYSTGKVLVLIIDVKEIEIVAIYLAIQELISGLSWLNPKWGEKDLTKYDSEIVKFVEDKLTSNDPFKGVKE
jgi:hypothetical protein